MNRLVKMLTIITVAIGVVGMVAGIFGMNFEIPFMKEGSHAFYIVLGGMIITSLVIIGIAWLRRWF